jgi:imidazolonepropionase-like amidohydrolase
MRSTGGYVPGPRIFSAGKSIATTGGHADPTNGRNWDTIGDPGPKEGVVNGPVEARKAVRQRYKDGADVIKITATGGVLSYAKNGQNPQFELDEIEAIARVAHDYGFKVRRTRTATKASAARCSAASTRSSTARS